jgi:hypothetical protein
VLSVEKIQKAIVPLAQKYGVDRVFLFGSYARGTATEKSDVDLRIDRGTLDGFRFGGFYVDVEETLNCKADILTTEQMGKAFLQHVQKEEVLLYDGKQQRLLKTIPHREVLRKIATDHRQLQR